MFKRKCKVIFVRHGATIYNEQGRLYDAEEYPPINQKGRIEIENLSAWLINKVPHVDAIYTSSTLRTLQSTRILAKAYNLDYKIVDGLNERKAGNWGGLTFEQIEEKYPDMLRNYHENPYGFCPEGGESIQELRDRSAQKISELVKTNEYKTIIIVTHEGIIQSEIALNLGVPPENQGKIIIPTGSASQLNFYEGWTTLVYSASIPQQL